MDKCSECGKETRDLDWGELNGKIIGFCEECIEYHQVFHTKIFLAAWTHKPCFIECYLQDRKAAKAAGRQ